MDIRRFNDQIHHKIGVLTYFLVFYLFENLNFSLFFVHCFPNNSRNSRKKSMVFWRILIVYVSSKHLSDWFVGSTYFLWGGRFGEKFFSTGTIFCLSDICSPVVHTQKFFLPKMLQLKKNNHQIRSDSSIVDGFTIKFTINSGSWYTPSFFSRSKIWIFPCYIDDIVSLISLEILGKKYGFSANFDRLCIL